VLGHDGEAIVGKGVDGVRKRSDEVHLEGVVIEGADPDCFGSCLTTVVLLSTDEEHGGEPRIGSTGLGGEDSQPTVDDVVGSDGSAIAPHGILAQREGVLGSFIIADPALCNTGNCKGGLRVIGHKALEDCLVDPVLRNTLDQGGVQ
jgi:hypothetical protein